MTSKSNAEKQKGKGAPVMEIVKTDINTETTATPQEEYIVTGKQIGRAHV